MEMNNDFEVSAPIDEAWVVLTDVEKIAPCLPGAQLQEVDGDDYHGVVKVKVGPITAQFKGTAHFVEKNDADHRAVIKGEGTRIAGQRLGADHRHPRGGQRRTHPGRRPHRSQHHRQGRPVRARRHPRRQRQADGPVRPESRGAAGQRSGRRPRRRRNRCAQRGHRERSRRDRRDGIRIGTAPASALPNPKPSICSAPRGRRSSSASCPSSAWCSSC